MATQSNILAWKTPWAEEHGGLQLLGHKESDMTEYTHTKIKLIENRMGVAEGWEMRGKGEILVKGYRLS